MKNLLIFLFTFSAYLGFAQCVPDQSITQEGIFLPPGSYSENGMEFMPDANSTTYSEVIQVLATDDTTIQGIYAQIDSFVIVDVYDFPGSFMYDCNTPTCQIPGGDHGCIRLYSNQVTGSGTYNFKVVIDVYANVSGQSIPPQRDTLDNYGIKVGTIGLEEVFEGFEIYPIPAKEVLNLKLPDQSAEFSIIDLQGKTHLKAEIENERSFDLSHMPKGLYLYQLRVNEEVIRGKLLIE